MLLDQVPQRVGEETEGRRYQAGYTEQKLSPKHVLLKCAFMGGQHSLALDTGINNYLYWTPGCTRRPCFGCYVHAGTLSSRLLLQCFEGFLG